LAKYLENTSESQHARTAITGDDPRAASADAFDRHVAKAICA